jgi:hypothetical protein
MRPVDVRIQAALATYDEDCRWELIGGAVTECPDDVLDVSVELLNSHSARERRLGADLLGRFVGVDPGARPTALETLLSTLSSERDPDCLASILAALGHVGYASVLERVIPYANHPQAAVRLAVAFAIATIGSDPLGPACRRAMIGLSRDKDPEVRDWATFGLGTLSSEDGPEIREALLERAEDAYHDARAEALFGLAVRRDPRAVPHLIRALQAESQPRPILGSCRRCSPSSTRAGPTSGRSSGPSIAAPAGKRGQSPTEARAPKGAGHRPRPPGCWREPRPPLRRRPDPPTCRL